MKSSFRAKYFFKIYNFYVTNTVQYFNVCTFNWLLYRYNSSIGYLKSEAKILGFIAGLVKMLGL